MFSKRLVSFSVWIDRTRWARNTWAMAAIFVLTMAVIADMVRSSRRSICVFPLCPRQPIGALYVSDYVSQWDPLGVHLAACRLICLVPGGSSGVHAPPPPEV